MEDNQPFFSINELAEPWLPPRNRYLTWNDVLHVYLSRVYTPAFGQNKHSRMAPMDAITELSKFVHEVWESGDGCPKVQKNIAKQFENEVLKEYGKYRRGEGRTRKSHKKKKTEAPPPPQRRSNRLSSNVDLMEEEATDRISVDVVTPEDAHDSDENRKEAKAKGAKRTTTTRSSDHENINKRQWMEDRGNEFFDVFSRSRLDGILNSKC